MSRYDILTRGLAAIATTVMTLSAAASQQTGLAVALPESDIGFSKTQDVMTIADEDGEPGRLYITNRFAALGDGTIIDYESGITQADGVTDANSSDGSVTAVRLTSTASRRNVTTRERVTARQYALPWSMQVTYGLNGPQTDSTHIAGADGLIDIRITVEPNPDVSNGYAGRSIPVIAFTVPGAVTDDITVGDGMTLTTQGSDFLISGVGKPGGRTVFNCYMNAKNFAMSQIAFATIQADDTATFATELTALARQADGLVDTLVTTGSKTDQRLINELTAMRNSEEQIGKQAVTEKSAAHKAAFSSYMAHYVGSYTTHLSGSIGSSTQMQALLGTAGELSGDTPMAQAVTDLANAVNAVSAAHQHEGAVQAIDDIIRRIRQRGTSGLAEEISEQMGQEATKGTSGYKSGQSQLSTAMIPYSMAYTDVYTKHLSELTGGSSANAAQYEQQAIDATNEEFATSASLKDDNQKVQSAMDSLAAASRHTGAANALQQISIQFAKELSAGDDANDSGGETADGGAGGVTVGGAATIRYGWAGPDADAGTMAVKAERKRVAEVAKANQEAAERKAKALASGKSDDNSQASMNIDDVMGSASGLGMLGGAVKGGNGSGNAAGNGSSSGAGKSGAGKGASDKAGSGSGAAVASTVTQVSPVYGMAGRNPRALLHADISGLVDETVEIGSAGDLLTAAAGALTGGSGESGSAESGDASGDGGSPAARLAAAFAAMACDSSSADGSAGAGNGRTASVKRSVGNADDVSDCVAVDGSGTYDVISALNRHTRTVRLLIIHPTVG